MSRKYNCDYAIQSKEVREKSIETSKKLYGVEHPMQSKAIQDKAKETCRERHGVDYPGQSEEVKDKIKQTNNKKYGCDYASQSEEVKSKVKQTCQQHYGVDCTFQAKEIKDKIKQTNNERYGRDYASQSEEVKDKIKQTNNEKYGGNAPACSKEVQEKMQQTMLKNHGVKHALQNKEIKEQVKQTNLERHGVECTLQSEEIKEKIRQTNLVRYGTENPMQNEKIKNKVFDSFQFNSTGPSSRAQRYICYILNGILNKHMCGSLVDIYMEKENIVIEHDGGGHFLGDKMNKKKGPTKESLSHKKQREDKIINNGYRMIRFIATKDRIPSDEIILNLIEKFKNSDFRVIRINFEEGTIEKDYNKKMIYNFGKLRRITKKDLEPFEKQKEKDTSKTSKKLNIFKTKQIQR